MRFPTLPFAAFAVTLCPLLTSAQLPVAFGVFPDSITFQTTADQSVPAGQLVRIDSGTIPFEYAAAYNARPNFVTVSPRTGVGITSLTVSLNPNVVPYLAPGRYILDLSLISTDPDRPGYGTVHIILTVGSTPAPVITSVVNSASQEAGLSIGTLVTIYGTNLGTGPVSPMSSYSVTQGGATTTFNRYPLSFEPLSNMLPEGNGTTVTFGGVPAPLLYISPTQINAVVPYRANGGRVVVTHNGQLSGDFIVPIAQFAPSMFTVAPNGRGPGAIQNIDSQTGAVTLNSTDNPAPKGSTIILYGTGAGEWSQIPPDGMIVTDVLTPPYYRILAFAGLTIGGQPAKVLYAGAAPGQVSGVFQVNAIIPDGIGSGPQPVVIKIGASDNSQQGVTVAVQ
jgi:uncharacterized protein (TIGR03437 family)